MINFVNRWMCLYLDNGHTFQELGENGEAGIGHIKSNETFQLATNFLLETGKTFFLIKSRYLDCNHFMITFKQSIYNTKR